MRCCMRNRQPLHYALYEGKTEIVDEWGNSTGSYEITYSAPVEIRVNISASRGTAEVDPFGINVNYSRTIVTDNMNLPLDTSSILWIGITPDADGEAGAVKHNYVVVATAKSLNSLTIAVKEVNVGAVSG